MRRILTFVSCWVLALTVSSVASADLAGFWDNVKSYGVLPGQQIRVVFTTSAVVVGNQDSHSFYQGFANDQVENGLITSTLMKTAYDDPNPAFADWKPLVTTASDANPWLTKTPVYDWMTGATNGNLTNLPVFNTQGHLVALKGSDMLNASLLSAAVSFDQSGDNQALTSSGGLAVWTGTGPDGKPFALGTNNRALGDLSKVSVAGDAGSLTNWLAAGLLPQASTPEVSSSLPGFSFANPEQIGRSIYVMSGEITVVPEPSTILLWLGMAGIAGVVFWRKRRS